MPSDRPDPDLDRTIAKLRQLLEASRGISEPLYPRLSTTTSQAPPAVRSPEAADVYRNLVARKPGMSNSPVLEKYFVFDALQRAYAECQTIVNYYQSGPRRTGFVGSILNRVQGWQHKMLGWFITPQVTFDLRVLSALREVVSALDLLQHQVHELAAGAAVLTPNSETNSSSRGQRNETKS